MEENIYYVKSSVSIHYFLENLANNVKKKRKYVFHNSLVYRTDIKMFYINKVTSMKCIIQIRE